MRHARSSWGIFSVPICFRKEMSTRIDPGIRVKELGGLYINFNGSKSKPVSSSLQKLKEKNIQDEVKYVIDFFFFFFWKSNCDAEWIMNVVAVQGQVNPIAPEMVFFTVVCRTVCCCPQVMKKSVIGPNFEKKDAVPPSTESKRALKLKRRVSFTKWCYLQFFLLRHPSLLMITAHEPVVIDSYSK